MSSMMKLIPKIPTKSPDYYEPENASEEEDAAEYEDEK